MVSRRLPEPRWAIEAPLGLGELWELWEPGPKWELGERSVFEAEWELGERSVFGAGWVPGGLWGVGEQWGFGEMQPLP